MAKKTFDDLTRILTKGLRWLQGVDARKYLHGLTHWFDLEIEATEEAIRARFPDTGPDDAIDYQAHDRDLPRYPGESTASVRERIKDPFEVWKWGGTKGSTSEPSGVERALAAMGCEDIGVYEDWEYHSMDGEWYSRFVVVIGDGASDPAPWAGLVAPFTTPATSGTTATREEVLRVVREVIKWKAPHGYPVRVIVLVNDAAVSGPTLIPPFTAYDEAPVYWEIGKCQAGTQFTAPFIAGGYQNTE